MYKNALESKAGFKARLLCFYIVLFLDEASLVGGLPLTAWSGYLGHRRAHGHCQV